MGFTGGGLGRAGGFVSFDLLDSPDLTLSVLLRGFFCKGGFFFTSVPEDCFVDS